MDLADALGPDDGKNTAAAGGWPGVNAPPTNTWPGQPGAPQWPGGPTQPGAPQWPGGPTQPGAPQWPGGPTQPGAPQWPGGPTQPGQPGGAPQWPGGPTQPGQPGGAPQWPGGPTQPGQPGGAPQWPGGPTQPGGAPQWPGGPSQPGAPGGWPAPGPTGPGQSFLVAPQTSLVVPYKQQLPTGVFDKLLITIAGKVKPNAQKFILDFSTPQDLAFHFNPRFNENGRKVIVRNSEIGKIWGKEERELTTFPFSPGQDFEIKILCTQNDFRVAVNKTHLLEFKHRVRNLRDITSMAIHGDISLSAVRLETLP